MRKIKIGQIGTGHMHAYKFGSLRLHPDVFEVVGLAEDDPKRQAVARDSAYYSDANWMSSEELLAMPDLDAILVEVAEHDSVEMAMRCVRAGKHIHVDKPGGESLSSFEALIVEAEKRKLTVQLGYMYRNSPAIQFCIQAVQTGLLGRLSTIDAAMNRCDGEEFRQLIKTFQGGAPYIFLCHLIDITVALMGAPERILPLSTCTRYDGVIDNGFTVMEFAGGCSAALRSSIVEVEGFQRRFLTLCGDKGTLTVQPLELQGNKAGGRVFLCLREANGKFNAGLQEIHQPPLRDRYEDHLLEFAHIVRGDIPNPYSYAHELLVQKCHLQACGYAV